MSGFLIACTFCLIFCIRLQNYNICCAIHNSIRTRHDASGDESLEDGAVCCCRARASCSSRSRRSKHRFRHEYDCSPCPSLPLVRMLFCLFFASSKYNLLCSDGWICRGLYGIFTDYIHGQYIRPALAPLVTIMSVLAFAGLCMLNINDVGFSRAVHKIYTEL